MGHCRSPSTETASLPSEGKTSTPHLKFPLGLVSESLRPYLELIRLEKVRIMIFRHPP
jgi:4-hydroxybenzoate polyprenyltransferase